MAKTNKNKSIHNRTMTTSSPALEDYFVHLMNNLPSPKAGTTSINTDEEQSMDHQTTTTSISNSSCEPHDSIGQDTDECGDGDDIDDEGDSISQHDLTIVMDNAHLPAHCFEFSAGYMGENVDNPMDAFSQSLSAINSVPFPPPFLKDTTSSSRWNFDESSSSGVGVGRDVSLSVPSRSRDDVLVFSDDENDDEDDNNSLTIHPPGHTSSLDSTTKWLRELPLEHSPLGRKSSPSSRSRGHLVRGSSGVGRDCRDTPLRCPPSPALCTDDDDELPSLRECPYDEEVEVHPRRSSLSGMVDVTAIATALELLEYDDNEEVEGENENEDGGSDSSVSNSQADEGKNEGSLGDISPADAVDGSQPQQREEEEKGSNDGDEDKNNHINDSSFLSVDGSGVGLGMDGFKFTMISPSSCQLVSDLLERRARISSHISPTGIVDFPYASPILIGNTENAQAPINGNKSTSTGNKTPKSSNGSSRHHQLVKQLSVVFENTDEMDLLVVADGIST